MGRIFVLPVVAIIFFAFTLKMKTIKFNVEPATTQAYEIQARQLKPHIPISRNSDLNNFSKDNSINDSIPGFYNGKKIKEAQGSEKLNKALISYVDGSRDTMSINEAEKIKLIPPPPPRIIRNETTVYVNPKDIKLDSVPGKNEKIFTKVEVEPLFPGGDIAWARYIKKNIEDNIQALSNENKSGTCRIRFIVNTDGTLSNFSILTMQGTKLAEVAIAAIKKGPNWNPAMQNGHIVAAYKEQPITFTIEEDK